MAIDALPAATQLAPLPFHFWSVMFFVLGCTVGSFLNVVIHRLPLDQSVVSPPSHCPHCQYSIPWYLNIPLVTWVMLLGKCRNCRAPISIRYFLVELLTGLVWLACWLTFGLKSPPLAVIYAIFLSGLVAGSFIDYEHMIIPDEITLGGIGAGLLASLFLPALQGVRVPAQALTLSALGAGLGAGIVYAVVRLGKLFFGRQKLEIPPDTKILFTETALVLPNRQIPYEEIFYRKSDVIKVQGRRIEMIDRGYVEATIRLAPEWLKIGEDTFKPEEVPYLEAMASEVTLPREAMGMGDVKFMAAIGAFLGWKATIFSLFGSSVIGAAVALLPYVLRWGKGARQVPFVPYLALAAAIFVFKENEMLIGAFKGSEILKWFLSPR